MSFLNSFDISVSGLTAQRQRLDPVAESVGDREISNCIGGKGQNGIQLF